MDALSLVKYNSLCFPFGIYGHKIMKSWGKMRKGGTMIRWRHIGQERHSEPGYTLISEWYQYLQFHCSTSFRNTLKA